MEKKKITNLLAGNLTLGINFYRNIKLISEQQLKDYISEQCSSILESHTEQIPESFGFSRKLYRSFHVDPTKHRPSSEALWRRLKNKSDFPEVNPFVDLTNLLSLKFQICYGLYDTDKIEGPIEVTIGDEYDAFQGIRKDMLNLKGKIVLKDLKGPFGNPSSDSLRTCTEDSTRNILQVLFFHPEDPQIDDVNDKTHETFNRFFEADSAGKYLIEE